MLRISARWVQAPPANSPRCYARARQENIGARLRLSPKKWEIAPPGFARCKTEAICPRDFVRAGKSRHACINRETGQLLVAPLIFRSGRLRSRPLHSQNRPDSLMVAHRKVLVRPPAESLHGLPLAFYPGARKRPSFRCADSAGRRKGRRALRCAPGASKPDAPNSGQRAAPLSCRMLPGFFTRAVIFKAAPKTGIRQRTLRFWGPRRLLAAVPVGPCGTHPTARFIEI